MTLDPRRASCGVLMALVLASYAAGQEKAPPQRETRQPPEKSGKTAPEAGRAPLARAAASLTVKDVQPGLSVIAGFGGNTTVRSTREGLILVDTKNLGEPYYNALIGVLTDPAKVVFVTHHHQDHSGNIGSFVKAKVPVIAHENVARYLKTYVLPQGRPEPPTETFRTDHAVTAGDTKAVAHYYGRGHTGGDIVVYFPDLKVAAIGDLAFVDGAYVDFDYEGSAVEWSQTLDKLLRLDFTTAIPGHGEP